MLLPFTILNSMIGNKVLNSIILNMAFASGRGRNIKTPGHIPIWAWGICGDCNTWLVVNGRSERENRLPISASGTIIRLELMPTWGIRELGPSAFYVPLGFLCLLYCQMDSLLSPYPSNMSPAFHLVLLFKKYYTHTVKICNYFARDILEMLEAFELQDAPWKLASSIFFSSTFVVFNACSRLCAL